MIFFGKSRKPKTAEQKARKRRAKQLRKRRKK